MKDLSSILLGSRVPGSTRSGRAVFGGGCKSRGEAIPTVIVLVVLTFSIACSPDSTAVDAIYDKATGKLTQLAADLNKDGKIDTWTYMNGAMPLRTEQDMDGDGKIERWEFSGPGGQTVKVALSRRKTGKPDIWTYLDAAGEPERIESASVGLPGAETEAKIDRIETYANGRLSRVAEDTDADGRMDKWEQHEGSGLTSVEYDHNGDGRADERVSFGPGGKVLSVQKIGS